MLSSTLRHVTVDVAAIAIVMHDLGLTDSTIASVTLYIDDIPRLTTRGVTWPKHLARIRFPTAKATGTLICLSSRLLISGSTQHTITTTLIHEIQHAVQFQNKDPRVIIGKVTEITLLLCGILLGLTDASGPWIYRILVTLITAFFGLHVGYRLALDEIQARRVASSYASKKDLVLFKE